MMKPTDFNQLPGNSFYTAKDKNAVKRSYKEVKFSKFPKRYMVWQAICSCGLRSRVFITKSTINSKICIKEWLQRRLLPFVRQHTGSVLFWPDLATSHYARPTLEWYEENGIQVVPKEANPPNCPELRPIERYWALMMRTLKKQRKFVNVNEM